MKIKTFNFIAICFMLSSIQLKAQNSYLNKEVNLQAGDKTIKEILNLLSNQTGCIFSYDTSIIENNQIVSFSSKIKLTLELALKKILPKNIDIKNNGKYIVLKNNEQQIAKPKKANNTNHKISGKIDHKPANERLVLPPMLITKIETTANNVIESEQKRSIDTTILAKIPANYEPADSVKLEQITALQQDSKPMIVIENINIASEIQNKKDTLNTETSNFYKYLNKNGFGEIGMGYNNRLRAIFIQCGLYNVYSILSIGTDNNKSYLLGIGAGINFELKNHLNINFSLLRNSLIAGKSYNLNVRASNTQFSPILNYSIGNTFRVFGGPTFNLIKSSYVTSVSTSDLGMLVAVGISVGVKIDLKSIIFTKS